MLRDGGRPFENALQNRETLFACLYECKNEVNRRTDRKSLPMQSVKRRYIAECSKGRSLRSRRA
jgi:hypothetical protein